MSFASLPAVALTAATVLVMVAAVPRAVVADARPNFALSVTDAGGDHGVARTQDEFGTDVAISRDGTHCIVGGPKHDFPGLPLDDDIGLALVYARNTTGEWAHQATLVPNATYSDDDMRYGYSVALSEDGSCAVVSALYEDSQQGAAYIWERAGVSWTMSVRLVAAVRENDALFGASVAVSDDCSVVAVGAYGNAVVLGAVHVFERSASGSWTGDETATVVTPAAGTVGGDLFGYHVRLAGDASRMLVTSGYFSAEGPFGAGAGAVFEFTRNGNGDWSEAARILETGRVNVEGLRFGFSLAADLTASRIVVGTLPTVAFPTGTASVLSRHNTSEPWTVEARLEEVLPAGVLRAGDFFGSSAAVSSDGSRVLVGAEAQDNGGEPRGGRVYVFDVDEHAVWRHVVTLSADAEPGASGEDLFGARLSISADASVAIVAAYKFNGSGAAFGFEVGGACDPGSSPAIYCAECPPATYSNGSGPCRACPTGTSTVAGEAAADASACVCASGTYPGGANGSCVACVAGRFCSGGMDSACDAGDYCPGGASVRGVCPAGSTCPGSSVAVPCAAGEWCPSGSAVPRVCPPSFFCEDPAGEPEPCLIGHFCPAGSTTSSMCTRCEGDDTFTRVECAPDADTVCGVPGPSFWEKRQEDVAIGSAVFVLSVLAGVALRQLLQWHSRRLHPTAVALREEMSLKGVSHFGFGRGREFVAFVERVRDARAGRYVRSEPDKNRKATDKEIVKEAGYLKRAIDSVEPDFARPRCCFCCVRRYPSRTSMRSRLFADEVAKEVDRLANGGDELQPTRGSETA